MKILIDTNVVLDAVMNREPWAKPAQEIFLAAAGKKFVGCVTASSFADIYYILRKHLKNKNKTKQVLLGLIELLTVLDVTGGDCAKAFDLPLPDYEDALLAYCGKRHKVDYIVTRDESHFANSPVPAVTPAEFLAL